MGAGIFSDVSVSIGDSSQGDKAMSIPCEVITWNQSYTLARRLARQVRASGYRPDVIVAIGRGGYVPARVLSDFLDQMSLASFKIEHYRAAHKEAEAWVRYPLSADVSGRRVLLVDDVSDSGDTFAVALEHLRSRGEPAEVRSAVLHHKTVSRYVPDYHAHKVVKWRWIIYPWAVAEDLGSFIRAMTPRPTSPDEIARQLAAEYGIRVPQDVLLDVLAMMKAE
jgi:hypoxanthine phosphoribosyltransferase